MTLKDFQSWLRPANMGLDDFKLFGSGLSMGVDALSMPIAKGNTSTAGNILGGIGSAASLINPAIGAAISGVGMLTDAAFGSNLNQGVIDQLSGEVTGIQNAGTYDQLADLYSSSMSRVGSANLGTQGWFSHKVDNTRKDLLDTAQKSAQVAANNINLTVGNQMKRNMLATGGGIYIKPKNRGKFTAAAKSRGMGVQEFASKVLANPEDYSTLMVKRANFARNFGGRRYEGGGKTVKYPESMATYFDPQGNEFSISLNELEGKQLPKGSSLIQRVEGENTPYISENSIPSYSITEDDYNKNYKGKGNHIRGGIFDNLAVSRVIHYGDTPAQNDTTYTTYSYQDKPLGLASEVVEPNFSGTIPMFNSGYYKAFGGPLDNTFTNGVTMIGNGGTHEQNPNDGVQMGIAPDGRPNLVEEGELVYNDYVFSNRLKVPKAVRERYHLKEGATYADAFKKAQKESEERPNDPISQNGLDAEFNFLANAQEAQRQRNNEKQFAKGGPLGTYFAGPGNIPNLIIKAPNNDVTLSDVPINISTIGDSGLAKEDETYIDNLLDISAQQARLDAGQTGPLATGLNLKPISKLNYAPVVANALAVGLDAAGITNKPTTYDYISPYTPIQQQSLGDYIQPELFDRNYWTNQALANQAATRRAVANMATPAAAANLIGADYTAGLQLGQLARQGQEYNREQALKAAEFNRGTNQANAQLAMEAATQNARNRLAYDEAALRQGKLNTDETNATWGARASNIESLGEALAGVGRTRDAINWRDALALSNYYGTLSNPMLEIIGIPGVAEAIQKAQSGRTSATGGKIKTKKKKGLTY